jgi:hypothetical protein
MFVTKFNLRQCQNTEKKISPTSDITYEELAKHLHLPEKVVTDGRKMNVVFIYWRADQQNGS